MKIALENTRPDQSHSTSGVVEHDTGREVEVAQKAFMEHSERFRMMYDADREFAEFNGKSIPVPLIMLPAHEIPFKDPSLWKSHVIYSVTLNTNRRQILVQYQDGRREVLPMPPACQRKLRSFDASSGSPRVREVLLNVVNRYVLPEVSLPRTYEAYQVLPKLAAEIDACKEEAHLLSEELDELTEIRSNMKEASVSAQEYLESLESDPKAEDTDLIVSTREQLHAIEERIAHLTERGAELMAELGGARERLAQLQAEVEEHTAEAPLLRDEDIQRDQEAISGVVALFSQQLPLDTWRKILEMKLEECKGGARPLVPLLEEEIKRIGAEDFEPGSEEYEIIMQGLTKRLGNLINLDEAKMRFLVSSSHESIAKLRSERVGSIPKG